MPTLAITALPDGSVHFINQRWLDYLDPTRDEQGRIIRWNGTRTDIEDRKQADEKYETLLESAPDAMVMVNGEGQLLIVDAQTEKLFGYGRREPYGRAGRQT